MKGFSVKTIFIFLFAAFTLFFTLPGNGQTNDAPGPPLDPCAKEGEECFTSTDCCEDLFCVNNKCAPCVGEGEACGADTGYCCEQLDCKNQKCTKCAAVGESCTSNGDCCFAFPIANQCVGGVCKACSGEGESCTSGDDCCFDLHCNSQKKCVTCLGDFEDCSNDAQCCGGFKCLNGYCGKCSKEGENCVNDSFCCDPNHECVGPGGGLSKCVTCKKKGESCSGLFNSDCCDGLDCIGGYCDDCSRLGDSCEEIRCCSEENLKCAPNLVCIECVGDGGQCQTESECCSPLHKCLGNRCLYCSNFDGACKSDSDCCLDILKCINSKCGREESGSGGTNNP